MFNKKLVPEILISLSFTAYFFAAAISNYSTSSFIIKAALLLINSLLIIFLISSSSNFKFDKFSTPLTAGYRVPLILITALIFYPLITLLWSDNASFGFLKWVNFILSTAALIFILYILIITWHPLRAKIFITVLLSAGILSVLYVIMTQPFNYLGTPDSSVFKWSHVIFGRFLAVVILLTLFLLLISDGKKLILLILCSTLFFTGLLFTGLRSAILGIAAVTIIYIISALYKKEHHKAAALILSSIAALIIFSSAGNHVQIQRYEVLPEAAQFEPVPDASVKARYEAWEMSIERIIENPLIGSGFGGFRIYYNSTLPLWMQYPHNIFLESWLELGLPGLILISLIIIFIFKSAYKISPYLFLFYLFALWLSLFSKDLATNSMLFSGIALLFIPKEKPPL